MGTFIGIALNLEITFGDVQGGPFHMTDSNIEGRTAIKKIQSIVLT